MLVQPFLNIGVLVGGVVVSNQMQRLVLGRFAVNLLEKLQPLGVGVSVLALADHLAV